MKILRILEDVEFLLVDIEVKLGNEIRNSPTLCVRYNGKIIPLNAANDGRPILMNEKNSITQ
jgi:hypothetical protein|tara:strand:+ start:5133 stop:5318 length:186 start_codon:yes stop_codon:yes gene_type:complete